MLTLVIAEAELELVPASICTHPVMVKSARKRGKRAERMLLDSNYHHVPMRVLEDAHRRGRPDIVHTVLLCALESVLNKQGGLNLYIHTRNDEVIHVDPKTKIPRSYNRFCGLMEQLLETGAVKEFLYVEKKSLVTLLGDVPGKKVIMHRKGVPLVMRKDMTCVVGGFPHGDFCADLAGERMKLLDEPLPAWTVVNELLVRYELL